jgi:DNA-binding beta-propeller fold protein YncE
MRPALRGALLLLVGIASCASDPNLPGYELELRFGVVPDGLSLGRISAVAVDSAGDVYAFQRGAKVDPILVFDANGKFLRSWGRGFFGNPHGIRVDADDHVWVTDSGDHQVLEFTKEGRLLRTLGIRGKSGTGDGSFDGPTDIAFAPTGDFYISDGYGNSRVVKFSRDGKILRTWGKEGTGPGEFDLPHSIAVDSKGRVYVSDRENNRIQIFDADGRFLRQWTHLGATQWISITSQDDLWLLAYRNNVEIQSEEKLAGRILHIDLESGAVLGSLESPGHGIHAGRSGEIFVAGLTGNLLRWHPPRPR